MMDPILADILAGINVVLFGLLAILALSDWWLCHTKKSMKWCWIKLAQGLLGMYWCGLYAFVVMTPAGSYNPVWFGQVFIRPAFTLTAGLMLAGAIITSKRQGLMCRDCKEKKQGDEDHDG